ncbi:MAG: aryl-sulfate sulfotransferase [Melioribacteraceae bacterium]|nr:aryl-sulfate sulfotransferase [Melioribacteraceae bacterium]
MKFTRILLISFCVLLVTNLVAQENIPYKFISPKPSSIMVSNQTNIILRYTGTIDQTTLSAELFKVEGVKSGIHAGKVILAEDGRTILFNPNVPFAYEEEVNVEILAGIKTDSGKYIPGLNYSFKTISSGIPQLRNASINDDLSEIENEFSAVLHKNTNSLLLPAPEITINSIDNPGSGNIFMATWDRNVPAKFGNFIFILDSSGVILDSVRVNGAPFDFQVQQNGLLSYALGDFSVNVPLPGEDLRHIVLNSDLTVVDSFKMKNGYTTDFHEFKLLPNGHAIMMSYHTIIYDMSKIIEGGKTDTELVINIIQEQDKDKNVVFEWRNIDYIPITDTDLALTDSRINYGTLNAFDIDDDGNILASFRNHSEIMKISRETGEVIWRMGGLHGEFTYVGEHEENAPFYHSRQHNIRRRPNGNITMFDNGQFHQPPYSRAVEYAIDEENKIATLVSDWRYPEGNIFCVTAGNAEPLPNGGWFIGYGVPNPQFVKRNVVEVHPDGTIALEISLPNGILAYRATKLPWNKSVKKPSFTNFEVKEGNTYSFNNESIKTGIEIKYNGLGAADYNESKITRLPYGPVKPQFIDIIISVNPVSIVYEGFAINSQNAEFHIDLEYYPEIKNPVNTIVCFREFPNQGLFVPKSTIYDSDKNELIVVLDSFGEIVFGVSKDSLKSNSPILYEPLNNQKLVLQDSILVKWTGKGMYNAFNVQVSEDTTFSTIFTETNTNLSNLAVSGLTNNTKYYWRVNSELGSEESEWSDIYSFNITDPYVKIISPNGGEVWANGSLEVIRWETNILENVHIDLINDNNNIFSLDTVSAVFQAYSWNLPEDLIARENYKIQITSESSSSIKSISENVFSIIDTVTSITNADEIPGKYVLYQNYPNPFNPTTVIEYSIPIAESMNASTVKLNIYNMLGQKIKTLVDKVQTSGNYHVTFDASDFASGIYIYKLETGNFSASKKLMILK